MHAHILVLDGVVIPNLRWLHDVSCAVPASDPKLCLDFVLLLLGILWADQAVHYNISSCPCQTLKHAETDALCRSCKGPRHSARQFPPILARKPTCRGGSSDFNHHKVLGE